MNRIVRTTIITAIVVVVFLLLNALLEPFLMNAVMAILVVLVWLTVYAAIH